MKNPIKVLTRAIRRFHVLYSMPLRLEFVVTDYCNLNCKGCTHYSPLAPKEFAELDLLDHNMEHLSRICGTTLKSVYLIGGETLLYPNLIEAMEMMYRHFPTQARSIFTNGIALPHMPEEFWEAVKRYDFIIVITRYPIKFDYDAVERLCKEKGVRTDIFADRSDFNEFFKFALDPEKKQNALISHFKCYNRGCMSIIGTRLYPCSISGCVNHLNRKHDTDFRHEEGDYLEIDKITSLKQIMRLRNRPVPFCSYCIQPGKPVGYGPSRRDKYEWVDNPK